MEGSDEQDHYLHFLPEKESFWKIRKIPISPLDDLVWLQEKFMLHFGKLNLLVHWFYISI